MGGLGRTINGSYAEYTRAPVSNVALIESNLPWAELAAIPETYATAWTCLFRGLEVRRGQLMIIRGATSSFGQAALKLAVNAGARVIATTRDRARFAMLEGSEPSAVKSSGVICQSICQGRRRLKRCSTSWVTRSCSIPLPCFAAVAVPVWPAG
jgi:threonine dehydrogenase-like Zn-dependent dehydrogenase